MFKTCLILSAACPGSQPDPRLCGLFLDFNPTDLTGSRPCPAIRFLTNSLRIKLCSKLVQIQLSPVFSLKSLPYILEPIPEIEYFGHRPDSHITLISIKTPSYSRIFLNRFFQAAVSQLQAVT